MTIEPITDTEFPDQIESGRVLVKFTADWCKPCKDMEPTLEAVADEFPNVRFVSLDIGANPMTPPQYGVRGVPALLLFKDGNLIDQLNKAVTQSELSQFLGAYT